MPARSKAQQQLMAIAEHHPEKVSAKNRGVLKMSHSQLHDFAATKEKKLPEHKRKKVQKRARAHGLTSTRRGNQHMTSETHSYHY